MVVQINLVPENLRKRKKTPGFSLQGFQLPREVVIGLIGGLTALLIFVHFLLQFFIILQFVQLHRYHGEKTRLAADKANADRVLGELRKIQANLKVIDGISKTKKIYWAPKMNAISDAITRGVWLERITVEEKKLSLNGSAVSKSAAEMIEVNNFVSKLKGDVAFSKDFSRIEPGAIKTRKISSTPVADFTITANIK